MKESPFAYFFRIYINIKFKYRIAPFLFGIIYFLIIPSIIKTYLWPSILLFFNNNPKNLFFYGSIACGIGSFFTVSFFFSVLYWAKIPWIESFKANNLPWPWEEDPEKWKKLRNKTLLIVIFNNLAINTLFATLDHLMNLGKPFAMSYKTEDFPGSFTFILHVLLQFICEDITSYMTHRTFHYGPLYKHIHKLHHEYKVSIGMAAEYAHPIEYFFGNVFSLSTGYLLFKKYFHIFSFFGFIVYRVTETIVIHSGYDFFAFPSTLLPFTNSTGFHDYHHKANVGNYGSQFIIMDTIFGTNKQYLKDMKKDKLFMPCIDKKVLKIE